MNIVLGVTGGIAAYKAADLTSVLSNTHNVYVIMTENSKKFIGPLTLSTLSKHPVYDDNSEWTPDGIIKHIDLMNIADCLIIAPATANTIAKLANGIADNLLSSFYLAFSEKEKLIVICPAMNVNMWQNKSTQINVKCLKNKPSHLFVGPVEGKLACGTVGMGKLAPTKQIVKWWWTKCQKQQ